MLPRIEMDHFSAPVCPSKLACCDLWGPIHSPRYSDYVNACQLRLCYPQKTSHASLVDAFPGCRFCQVHPLAFLPFLSYALPTRSPARESGAAWAHASQPPPEASRFHSVSRHACGLYPVVVCFFQRRFIRTPSARPRRCCRLLPEFSHFVRVGRDNSRRRARKMEPGYLAPGMGKRMREGCPLAGSA